MDVLRNRFLALSMLAFVGGVWLIAHPYFGVWHDSVLYTVQALHRLRPDIWEGDLFFRYGSQDQFTVFSTIHAWLLDVVGIQGSALLLTIVGKILWFAALSYFVAGYLRGFPFWLGLVVLASYSPIYDGNQIFSYGESFATGRLYAEVLSLFALGLMVRGRERGGIAMAMAALLLHPLMALPGLAAVALLSRNFGKPLALAGLAGTATVVVLGLVGIEPFSRLFARFDPLWLEIIEKRVPYIFLENWSDEAFGRLALLVTLLLICRRMLREQTVGRLADRMLMLGFGCLTLAWLGSSMLNDVLITQLQLWRGLWIVQIVALSLLGPLTVLLWGRRAIDRILLICLWSALLLKGLPVGVMTLASLSLWWILDRKAPNWQPTRLIWAAILLLPLVAVVFAAGSIQNTAIVRHKLIDRPFWAIALCDPLLAVPILGGLVLLASRYARIGATVAGLAGIVTLVAGMMTWDVRYRYYSWDDYAAAAQPLQAIIPVGSTVYWLGSAEPTWFWLRRAHYVSKQHTVGALFSRKTAMLIDYRQSRLLEQKIEDGYPNWQQRYRDSLPPGEMEDLHPGMKVAVYLCQDSELDFLVLPENKEFDGIAYRFTYPADDLPHDLLDCRRLHPENSGTQG
jgi:hypothetical protein